MRVVEITLCDEDYQQVGQEADTVILADGISTQIDLENGRLSPEAALWMHQHNVSWEIDIEQGRRQR